MPRPPASWIPLEGEQAWEGFLIKYLFYLLKCSALWPLRVEPTFDLNDGGGFVSWQQQLAWCIMSPLNPTRLRIWRQKESRMTYWTGRGKTRGRDTESLEELKLKKIVTVMKSFGFAVAIDTPWPFHSESAAESTHYSGTPEAGEHSPPPKEKINREEKSGQLCRAVEEYFMGERSIWKADKTLPVSAPESCDVWSGQAGVVI